VRCKKTNDYRYQGTASVSKRTIFLTVIKLLIVAVPFILTFALRWAERVSTDVLFRLSNALFKPKNECG
jgi:hypothetical protein